MTTYACGCVADGDLAAAYCPQHGEMVQESSDELRDAATTLMLAIDLWHGVPIAVHAANEQLRRALAKQAKPDLLSSMRDDLKVKKTPDVDE